MLKVSYIGFNEYLARIKAAPANIQKLVDDEVQFAALNFRDGAKRDLANQGGGNGALMGSIAATNEGVMKARVSVNLFYAPYVEFGTKKKVKIEPGFEDVAASAKGLPKRGTWKDFIASLTVWAGRKGIKGSVYAIARSIMLYGISPKPFFFKQYTPVRNKLKSRIENLLKSGI